MCGEEERAKTEPAAYQERVQGGIGREAVGKARVCDSVWGRGDTDKTQALPPCSQMSGGDWQQKAALPTVASAMLAEVASAVSHKGT